MRLPWLSFARREREIMDGIIEDFGVVRGTIVDFRELVLAAGARRAEDARASLAKVLKDEEDADAIHRRLSTEIAEGAFFGGVREDMLTLLETMDDIADSAKGAARFLETEETLDESAAALLGSKDMASFLDSLVAALDALGVLLSALRVSRKEAMAKIAPVEACEEAADALKSRMMKVIFDPAKRPDALTVIQLRDFLTIADNVADKAEDVSDVILILLAKGYG